MEQRPSFASPSPILQRRILFHPPFRAAAAASPTSSFGLQPLNSPPIDPPSSRNGEEAIRMPVLATSQLQQQKRGESPEQPEITMVQRIGAGLANLGNTCFLNAVLQCLTYTPPLAAYVRSGRHKGTCRVSGFCAMCALEAHVKQALTSFGRVVSPTYLVRNLRCISRSFRVWRQEDAHEYMRYLIEALQKCCLPVEVVGEALQTSFINKIFGGRLRSQVKCTQCSSCSNTYDPFLDLSLEIVRADSLLKALAHFTAVEVLDGDNKYRCSRCKTKVRALKRFTIDKAPHILTIQFKRFSSTGGLGGKIDKKVQFEQILDMKPFVSSGEEEELKYTLYAVLVHSGWSTHSGHYYCFVRTATGMWHVLDDSRVAQVSERTVIEQKAYILFYMREMKTSSTSGIKTPSITKCNKVSCTENGLQNIMNCSRNIVLDSIVSRSNDAQTQLETQNNAKSHGVQSDQRRTRSKSFSTVRLFMPPLRNHLLMKVLAIPRLKKHFVRTRSSQGWRDLAQVTAPHRKNGNVVKLAGADINANKKRLIEDRVSPRRKGKGHKVSSSTLENFVSLHSQANIGKPNHLNGVKKTKVLCSDKVGSDLSLLHIGGQFDDCGKDLNGCHLLKPSHPNDTSSKRTTRTGLTQGGDNCLPVHKDRVADLNEGLKVLQSIKEGSSNGYLDKVPEEFEIQIEPNDQQVSRSPGVQRNGLTCEMVNNLDGSAVPSISGPYGAEVPCWSEVSGAARRGRDSLLENGAMHCGHILDEWDQEYDRGKRKKVRMRMVEGQVPSAGKVGSLGQHNIFQDFSNSKLYVANRGHKFKKRHLIHGGISEIKRPKTKF